MTPRIERLHPDDWARWRAVRLRALGADPAAFACSAHASLGPDATESTWRAALVSRHVFVAVDERAADVAMVGLATDAEPELISMWVAPEARGTGVGRLLVETVLATAGDRDVTLRVMAQNGPAIDFYRGCGFEPDGRAPDAEGTVRMRRAATPATTRWPPPAERPRRPGGWPPARSVDQ